MTTADRFPVVTRLSFPKSISSDDDTIDPFVNVISPNCVPEEKVAKPPFTVPLVDKLLLPNVISPPESEIEPSENVKLPIVEVDDKFATPAFIFPFVVNSLSTK